MKSLTQHIAESLRFIDVNEAAKYDISLVQDAISMLHMPPLKSKDEIIKIADEAKGYSYQVKSERSSKYHTISYKEVNDYLDHHAKTLKRLYFVNEKWEIEVSIRHAKEANNAINDTPSLKKLKQTSSNTWTTKDKSLIDEIEEVFKSWKIPTSEYEIEQINESREVIKFSSLSSDEQFDIAMSVLIKSQDGDLGTENQRIANDIFDDFDVSGAQDSWKIEQAFRKKGEQKIFKRITRDFDKNLFDLVY